MFRRLLALPIRRTSPHCIRATSFPHCIQASGFSSSHSRLPLLPAPKRVPLLRGDLINKLEDQSRQSSNHDQKRNVVLMGFIFACMMLIDFDNKRGELRRRNHHLSKEGWR